MRLIALLLLPVFASCQLLTELKPKHATYTYVGKVTTGKPSHVDTFTGKRHETIIPLSFTGGQWQQNSAICFYRAEAKVVGHEIHITILTGLCPDNGPLPTPEIRLKGLTLSEYDLIYIDPDGTRHPIGKLRP